MKSDSHGMDASSSDIPCHFQLASPLRSLLELDTACRQRWVSFCRMTSTSTGYTYRCSFCWLHCSWVPSRQESEGCSSCLVLAFRLQWPTGPVEQTSASRNATIHRLEAVKTLATMRFTLSLAKSSAASLFMLCELVGYQLWAYIQAPDHDLMLP
jgi:hypothetical protein